MDARARLLCNLRVLAQVQQNQRVGVADGAFVIDTHWLPRRWRGDSRERLCAALAADVEALRSEVEAARAWAADMRRMKERSTHTTAYMLGVEQWLADVDDARSAAADAVQSLADSTYSGDVRTAQRLVQLARQLRQFGGTVNERGGVSEGGD